MQYGINYHIVFSSESEAQSHALTKTIRGYTSHEHLPHFALINMNGRMYDPALGRMLSPDNYVQDPNNAQNYNRYTYVLNNPLKYTDPSGEFWHLVIGAIIGGTINWLAHGAEFNAEGAKYFAVGALAGALSAGVGAGVGVAVQGGSFGAGFIGTSTAVAGGGFLGGASAGFTNGFITGTGNSLIEGEKFSNSLIKGLKSGSIQGLIGGTMVGTGALLKGRSFWTGDVTFKYKFNYYLATHDAELRKEFGDELVDNTEIKSGRRIFMSNKAYGNTVKTNTPSGYDFYGVPGEKTKIIISRKVVRMFYRNGDIRATGVIFHEFYHAKDYYSGWDAFLSKAIGEEKAGIILEYNTYQRVYNLFGVGERGVQYYQNLYYNQIFCY